MGKLASILPALVVITLAALPLHAAAQVPQAKPVYELITIQDGKALYLVRAPEGYRIADVRLRIDWQPYSHVEPGAPLLAAYTPDPRLWERLRTEASVLVAPVEPRPMRLSEDAFVVWLPAGVGPSKALTVRLEPLQAAPAGLVGAEAVVIVPNESLRWFGEELARLHSRVGVETVVVTLDWIRSRYEPAEPPPGYLEPGDLERYGARGYDLDTALRIVSFLRDYLSHPRLHYVVLVGSASEIPPIYYWSPLLAYFLAPQMALVPSDYWYMDPDYNYMPQYAVGRIPFTDPGRLRTYLEALEKWIEGGEWQLQGLLAGGAPFAWLFMAGETGVQQAAEGIAKHLSRVEYVLETLGNYGPGTVGGSVGDYGLFYIVSHGMGDKLVDYEPKGLWGGLYKLLVDADAIMATRGLPGVYISPACQSAQWDYDVVKPPFEPPSVGVALVGSGNAVAYMGPSRIALELLVSASFRPDTSFSVEFGGAVRLASLTATWLGREDSVGEAFRRAVASYLSLVRGVFSVSLPTGGEDIAVLTVQEFILLGDPVAPSPWSRQRAETPVVEVEPVGADTVDADTVVEALAGIARGSLAFYKRAPGENITLAIKPCPTGVEAVAVKRYYSFTLADLIPVDTVTAPGGEGCNLTITVEEGMPAVYLLDLFFNNTFKRLILVAAGARAYQDGGSLVVEAAGLDLLRTLGDEPILVLVNDTLASMIPGGVDGGVFRIPVDRAGRLLVELRPWRSYAGLTAGYDAGLVKEKLVRQLSVEALVKLERSLDLIVSPETSSSSIVAVMLDGRLVDANVTAAVVGGTGSVVVEKVSPGVYRVTLASGAHAVVRVEAVHENRTLHAQGYTVVALWAPRSPPVEYGSNPAVAALAAVGAGAGLVALALALIANRKDRAYKTSDTSGASPL